LVIGVLSVLIGTFFSLRQKKIKKLIIYSSIAQIGFPIAALGSNSFDSYIFVYFFLITYMLTSILVWGNIVTIQNSQKSLNNFFNTTSVSLFLSSLSNLFSSNKIWSLSFLFIFFSISGIPPLLGFLSKIFILLSLIEGKQILTAISIVLISVVSVFYYIRIIKIVFFEISSLQKNNNKFMQITLNSVNNEVLVFSTFLFFLLILFFYPTPLLLLSEHLVLNLLVF